MTIWAAISWISAGPVNLNYRITASHYVDILEIQEHPVVQILFPKNDGIFQDDNSSILTARSVQS